jgi:hypothetical protein
MFLKLDPIKIVETLEQLQARVRDRFPGAGLAQIGAELTEVARRTQARSEEIAHPHFGVRAAVAALLIAGAGLLLNLAWTLWSTTKTSDSLFDTLQGIDSGFNILLLMGATLFFMVTLEERLKRRRALTALHELRSIIHVIDMHQLTKDPSTAVAVSQPMRSSPRRTLTTYEVIRYLDYCSEMLSLSSKVAVLYSQSFPDPVVTEAVNDLERTATSLSQKIWQKINILHRDLDMGEVTSLDRSSA